MRLPKASPWLVAALLMAASGFVVLIVAARSLSLADNSTFLVYWSALYGITGALAGIQNESSRAMASRSKAHAGGPRGAPHGAGGAPVLGASLLIGAALATVMGLTAVAWLPRLIGGEGIGWAIAMMAAAVVGYAGHNAAVGAFMGTGEAEPASLLIAAEAVARFAAFLLVAAVGWGLAGFQAATALPMLLWVAVLAATGRLPGLRTLRADESWTPFVRHCAYAIGAGALTSLMVNGYPALLKATTPTEEPALAVVILAISLTRAPLLVPVISFQGVIVAYFVRESTKVARALVRATGVVWALVAVVAPAMWLLGPWVMRLLYGPDYDLRGATMALLTVGAGTTATLVVTGSAALARGQHRWFLAAWVAATSASVALLLWPGTLESRVILSLTLGPLAGALVALVALRRRRTPVVGGEATPEPDRTAGTDR